MKWKKDEAKQRPLPNDDASPGADDATSPAPSEQDTSGKDGALSPGNKVAMDSETDDKDATQSVVKSEWLKSDEARGVLSSATSPKLDVNGNGFTRNGRQSSKPISVCSP
jgi:hypothetical protein